MTLPRLLLVLAALAAAPAEARAQSFFEELFGLKPRPAPVPPGSVPGGRGGYAPAPIPGPAPQPGAPDPLGESAARPAAPAPAPPRPVVVRAPNDADALGRDLMRNGTAGTMRLERGTAGMTARIMLAGNRISQPVEACTVRLGEGEALPLTERGRPEGVTRLEVSNVQCPLRLEILDGAVLATLDNDAGLCTFTASDCQVEPKGLWGPAPATLLPRAGEFESARGSADRAVRDNYRVLGQRAGTQGIRPVVAEQAAFSSEREQLCRSYAREAAHGFCHLRFTEARGLSLATRLGIATAPGGTAAATPRPRRRPTETSVIEE